MDVDTKILLTRGVEALEALAKDPEIQVPAFPAVCPHCEEKNPQVQISETGGVGKLAEFLLRVTCMYCNKVFYALPMQWICVGTVEEAKEADKERAEFGGYN